MGLLTFAASPTGSGTVATQAKIESLASAFVVKIHMTNAIFSVLPQSENQTLFSMDKSRAGQSGGFQMGVSRGSGNDYGVYYNQGGFGAFAVRGLTLASIPANVVLYAYAQNASNPNAGGCLLFNADTGAELTGSDAAGGYMGDHQTSAGCGAMTLHNRALAAVYQSLAVYSARLTGGARAAAPVIGDASLVALYPFNEGTTTTPDTTTGTALSFTNGVLFGTTYASRLVATDSARVAALTTGASLRVRMG